jgi:hypothetical protein
VNKVLDANLVVCTSCYHQRRKPIMHRLVDVCTKLTYKTSHQIHMTLTDSHAQGRGSILRFEVDISAEVIHEASENINVAFEG